MFVMLNKKWDAVGVNTRKLRLMRADVVPKGMSFLIRNENAVVGSEYSKIN